MKPAQSLAGLRRAAAPAAVLALAALAACSSGPPPAPALAVGASSIEAARSSGAPELAAVELNSARNKLERARALAQSGKNHEAVALAEEADADAQLARARAGSERSKRAVTEVEASLRTLQEELGRAATNTPVRPAQ
jgi:hypothetical protein